MKKIFLSLLTVFMVLSLSVVLVKAEGETSVALTDGVQIRTDGNNGLRWEATVTKPAEGDSYGFLFAQGEYTVDNFPKDTAIDSADTQVISELKEDGTFAATMTNFPKAAAVKDISVLAYVKNGETVTYSTNVVVRNLSEVAIEAYEVKGLTDGFVKAVYDASLTTFNLNDGQLLGEFEFVLQNFDNYTGLGAGTSNGIVPISKAGTRMNYTWNRIVIEYDSELGLWYSVGVGSSTTSADISGSENAYVIGSHSSNTDTQSKAKIDAIFNEVKEGKVYYFNLGTFNLENIPSSSNSWYQHVSADTNPELLVGTSIHLGGGEILPNASKDYYDFAGWYNNAELTGDKIVNQGKDRNLYAKYTPTKYTITYNLNGGACSTSLVEEYNIESEKITLPTAAEMSIADGKFVGWYDNASMSGDAVTEIATGSHGDLELYALWQMDAPTIVELSAADTAVLEKVTPTIIVNTSVTVGKYIVNEIEYSASVSAFSNITLALAAAKENDIIYVFNGTYSETLTISVSGVTLVGPNYDIKGQGTRSAEATLDGELTISSSKVTINGLKHTKAIKVGANNVTIANCYIAPTATVACNGNNRRGCIVDSANISDLTISNCYINAPGTANSYTNQYMSFTNVSNLTIQGNYITNSNCTTSSPSYNGMRIYTCGGFIKVIENEFRWGEGGSLMNLGTVTNNCTDISIIDNYIDNNGLIATAGGIFVNEAKATLTVQIMGNTFKNCATRVLRLSYNYGPTVNVMYNYFAEGTKYETYDQKTAVVNFTNNYYVETQTTTTSDYGVITSKEALDAAYAEYLATLE